MSRVEAQLRQEIAQLTAALEETDEALDEWIAETERLQEVLKTKDKETKQLLEQMDELRIHSLKLIEDYQAQQEELKRVKSSKPAAFAQAAVPAPAKPSVQQKALEQELANKNAQLSEQLSQAQDWVAQGLKKLELAEQEIKLEQTKRAKVEQEHASLLEGKKMQFETERDNALWHVGRLENVVHALELELKEKRKKVDNLHIELVETRGEAGKWQAFYAMQRFQAESSNTDNMLVVNWMKSVVRWSAKL